MELKHFIDTQEFSKTELLSVMWAIGTVRTSAQAGEEGELPAYFGKLKVTNQTPVSSLILIGIIASLVFIIYGIMAANSEDLFWTFFAFSSMLFFICYAILFPAFLALRLKDKDQNRPYKVPGGNVVAYILAIVCEVIILANIVFFIWVAGEPIDVTTTLAIKLGIIVKLSIGDVLLLVHSRKKGVA